MNTIHQYDAKKLLKYVCIENVRHTNPSVLQKVTSVPALMFVSTKQLIYGRKVFDYLILPNKGIIVTGGAQPSESIEASQASQASEASASLAMASVATAEPVAMTIDSDPYAFLDDQENDNLHVDKKMIWEDIHAVHAPMATTQATQQAATQQATTQMTVPNAETRTKKEPLDLERIQQQRQEDLNFLQSSVV